MNRKRFNEMIILYTSVISCRVCIRYPQVRDRIEILRTHHHRTLLLVTLERTIRSINMLARTFLKAPQGARLFSSSAAAFGTKVFFTPAIDGEY